MVVRQNDLTHLVSFCYSELKFLNFVMVLIIMDLCFASRVLNRKIQFFDNLYFQDFNYGVNFLH